MDRNAVLEITYRLAASSGITYRAYHDRRRRAGWDFVDGLRWNTTEAFYEVRPDGRAKFFFSSRDHRGTDLSWCWKR